MTLGTMGNSSSLTVTSPVLLAIICIYLKVGNKWNVQSVVTLNLFINNAISFTRIKVSKGILVGQRVMIKVVFITDI